MNEHSSRNALIVWTGWLLAAGFLRLGPASLLQNAQHTLQGSLGSVLALVPDQFTNGVRSDNGDERSPAFQQLQAENQELKRTLAELRSQQQQALHQQELPYHAGQELLNVQVTSARVLGRKGDPLSSNLQLLISLGKSAGLNDADLVLAGEGLLIDAGRDLQLQPDQYITAGRSLLGRTTRVGRNTSLVQPLTDSTFRMAVRIVRKSQLGPIQGPAGVLAGTGDGCRIDEVSATDAVAVGDDVYSDPSASPTGVPVYCGRIVLAEIPDAANHWTINMEPVNTPSQIPLDVQVLKSALNSKRISSPGSK